MLSKLMKYELMATGRIFLPLFAALLIISTVNRLLAGLGGAPYGISITVAIMLIVAVFVVVLIITIQRFWQNLLSGEGHLMMTLPVKTDNLIFSKMFTAAIWSIGSFLITVAAILIMTSTAFTLDDVGMLFTNIGNAFSQLPPGYVVTYIVEVLLFVALAIFSSIVSLYAIMSLSMLVNKRRGLFAFAMYIAVSTVMQIVVAVLGAVFSWLEREWHFFANISSGLNEFGQTQIVIVPVLVLIAGISAAFYFVTRYMLKNRLNLQ